jgi:hypothetical protein
LPFSRLNQTHDDPLGLSRSPLRLSWKPQLGDRPPECLAMALTVAAVDEIRARLAAVPAKDASARAVTRVEAVTRMRGEILALRKRGYSWEEVAAMVSTEGCRVAAATLRTELSRKRTASKAKTREAAPSEKKVAKAVPAGAATAPAPAAPPAKVRPTAAAPPPQARIGSFAVREDSEI